MPQLLKDPNHAAGCEIETPWKIAALLQFVNGGDRYLRTLMIHGARAALTRAGSKQDPRSLWLGKLRNRRHANVAAVALANKNARIVWAMLAGNTAYQPELSIKAA